MWENIKPIKYTQCGSNERVLPIDLTVSGFRTVGHQISKTNRTTTNNTNVSCMNYKINDSFFVWLRIVWLR